MKLTEKRIRDLNPKPKQFFVWDDELPGFGVRVGASSSKSYVLRYRVGGGRTGQQRRATLSKCSSITLESARRIAREYFADIRNGGDPLGDRRKQRAEPTCNDLFDRYIIDHAAEHKAVKSRQEDERYITKVLKPKFGTRKVRDITLSDAEALHKSLRSTPIAANRVLSLFSKILNLAERWHMREVRSNPCSAVARNPEESRDRYYSTSEIQSIGRALRELEPTSNPFAILAIKLAFLLGLRIGEIQNMKWENINFETQRLTIEKSKTGRQQLSLPTDALDLLSACKQVGPFVIAGRSTNKPLDYKSIHGVWVKIRGIAGLENARVHDLRHTVATLAAGTGAGAHLIRDLIGHKTLAMANRYVGRMDEPVSDLREQVAGQITKNLNFEQNELKET